MCTSFRDVITGSPLLQYSMELEIAGFVDRPCVRLPLKERLEYLKAHQERLKDPGPREDRPVVRRQQHPNSERTKLIGDLLFTPYVMVSGDPSTFFDSIDIGYISPVCPDEDNAIQWWTVHPPHSFDTLYADPSQDMLVLLDWRSPGSLQIMSITSGKSLIDREFLNIPTPDPLRRWFLTDVHIYGDLIAHSFVTPSEGCGITMVGWRDGVVRVASFSCSVYT